MDSRTHKKIHFLEPIRLPDILQKRIQRAAQIQWVKNWMRLDTTFTIDFRPVGPPDLSIFLQKFRPFHQRLANPQRNSWYFQNIIVNCLHSGWQEARVPIYFVLEALQLFLQIIPVQKSTFWIYLTDLPRIIPSIIHPEGAPRILQMEPSGSTWGQEVYITRREDIIRLLLHELVHLTGLDKSLGYKLSCQWDIDPPTLNPSEAYAEMMAIVWKCCYLSNYLPLSLEKMFTLELLYSFYLCSQLLHHLDYDRPEDFFQDRKNPTRATIPIWEYILLRTLLMCHLDTFLETFPYKYDPGYIYGLITPDIYFLSVLNQIYPLKVESVFSYSLLQIDWQNIV
jgi:hypothetical protein